MKENLELVEKLVQKTGVSYAEAKAVLEKSDWDILDAIIMLEADGKTFGSAHYSTDKEARKDKYTEKEEQDCKSDEGNSFFLLLGKIFDKGNKNRIEMYKDSKRHVVMPVTIFIVLVLFGFWIVLPLMVVGLFFGCSYRFAGPDLGKEKVNNAMGKANQYAEEIKKDFKEGTSDNRK